jgi:hypothetical protein
MITRTLTLVATLAVVAYVSSATAQTCNPSSGAGCSAPQRGRPIEFSKPNYDPNEGRTIFSGISSPGSRITGAERPATLGAINFSGGRVRCAGPFRARDC